MESRDRPVRLPSLAKLTLLRLNSENPYEVR
jgi:hypothetical protein